MLDDLLVQIEVDTAQLTAAMPKLDEITAGVQQLKVESTALMNQPLTLPVGNLEATANQLAGVQQTFENISSTASDLQFNLNATSRSLSTTAVAAKPLNLLGQRLSVVSGFFRLAAHGAADLAAVMGLTSTLATYLASGIALIIAPLRGLIIVPRLIAGAFSVMVTAIVGPLSVVIGAVRMFVKGIMTAIAPVLSLARTFFHLKVSLSSLKLQLALLGQLLAILPPKLRATFVGLVALGVAGRAGSAALALGKAAARGFLIALTALQNPLKAARMLMASTARTLWALTVAAVAAGRALGAMAIQGATNAFTGLVGAIGSVSTAIGGKLLQYSTMTAKVLATLAIGAAGWGVALASDAEQAQIGFQTMLKSADAAKAVLFELEEFAASTPFQLTDLRDGATQLLQAQVPAAELTKELRKLGDLAAITGKPIGDFVAIFAKVRSTGKLGLEELQGLAKRGVPIYTALQEQLGVSREEMLKMISAGELGFDNLNRALISLTEGQGVFAGGSAAAAQTINGLWSTLKDNVSFAARELGMNIIEAFDFRTLLNNGIALFQSLRKGIADAMPAFTAVAIVVKAAFAAVWEVITVTFSSIAAALGMTGGDWMTSFVTWAAVAAFAFKAWPDIAQLAFTKLQLWIVQTGANFAHLFTGVLPGLLSWFGDNWADVFFTAFDYVSTIFINLGQNIRNAMTAIWNFIASGGTKSLEIAWTPLTEGFHNSLKELPDIPARAIGPLEKALQEESDRLGSALTTGLEKEIESNLDMLDEFRKKQANATKPEIGPTALPDATVSENTAGKTFDAAGAIEKGSQEAFSVIFANMRRGEDNKALGYAQQTAKAAQQTARSNQQIADKLASAPQIAVWEGV